MQRGGVRLQEQNSAEFMDDVATSRSINGSIRRPPHESKDTRLPTHMRCFQDRAVRSRGWRWRIWGLCGRTGLATVAMLFAVAQMLLAVPLSGPALAVDAPEGTVKAQHGDWQVVCKDPPPGSKNPVCALVQSVTAEDKNNIGLTVYFQKFSNGTRVLRVFAPLGVLLPPGLGLKIDNKDVGHAPFLRCHSFACYAQVVVDDPLIKQLETGKTAIFIIFQTEEAGIGIPISLKGFAEAMKDLN
jgi:invasion protein IalB